MVGYRKTTLSSACRCGYPEKVDWSDFKAQRERADLTPKELPNGRFMVAA
jgi:hypothetical protein